MTNIIQWHIAGMQANREELQLLLSDFYPRVVCLQETLKVANSNLDFWYYFICHCSGM